MGRSVLELLNREGVETVVAGRRLPQGVSPNHFYEADILGSVDFEALTKSSGATHLLHLAWYAEHGKFWTSPLNLRWVDATVRLAEAFCRAGGQKIVMAGTCAEYDWSYGYCSERHTPLNPDTLYGITKDATRRLVAAVCAEHRLPFTWGRIFIPYGPGEDRNRLIPALIDVFENKRTPFSVNSNFYRDFIHVDDVANGFWALLNSTTAGEFNICSGQPLKIADLVEYISLSRNGCSNSILNLSNDRNDGSSFLVGNNQKLHSLGWQVSQELNLRYFTKAKAKQE